jgi:ribosomal protein S20
MQQDGETPEEDLDRTPPPKPSAEQVGYGHPPQSTRFKPGRSGNPKGRPKGSLNIRTLLASTLRERVVINENGQRKAVTKLEAALKQLTNKAASGDLRAILQLVGLATEAEEKENMATPQKTVTGEIDQKVMQGILDRFQVANEPEEGQHAADRG